MKRIISLFALLITLHASAGPLEGTLTYVTNPSGYSTPTTYIPQIPYISEAMFYNVGGLTYTYPVGLFNSTPLVLVSITLVSPATLTDTYSAVIASGADNISATVLVYRISNGGTVTQASASEVLVTLFAFGN